MQQSSNSQERFNKYKHRKDTDKTAIVDPYQQNINQIPTDSFRHFDKISKQQQICRIQCIIKKKTRSKSLNSSQKIKSLGTPKHQKIKYQINKSPNKKMMCVSLSSSICHQKREHSNSQPKNLSFINQQFDQKLKWSERPKNMLKSRYITLTLVKQSPPQGLENSNVGSLKQIKRNSKNSLPILSENTNPIKLKTQISHLQQKINYIDQSNVFRKRKITLRSQKLRQIQRHHNMKQQIKYSQIISKHSLTPSKIKNFLTSIQQT